MPAAKQLHIVTAQVEKITLSDRPAIDANLELQVKQLSFRDPHAYIGSARCTVILQRERKRCPGNSERERG